MRKRGKQLLALFTVLALLLPALTAASLAAGPETLSGTVTLSESKTCPNGLIIADGAVISAAAEDHEIVLTVNGVQKELLPGTYEGDVVLTNVRKIEDIYASHGQETTQTMTAALSIGSEGIRADESVTSALVGVTFDGKSASGGSVTSEGHYFGGIRVGGDAEYVIENVTFRLTGNGGNDFTGIGVAVAAVDNAKVTVRNCVIETEGALRGAFFAGDNAVMSVENCEVHTKSLWSAEEGVLENVEIPTAGMAVPPAGLGVYGNNRSNNLVDSANVTYTNCKIYADSWGAMGSDDVKATAEAPVYMNLNGCYIEVSNAGYGAYSIGHIWDVLDDTDIVVDNGMGVIVAAEGSARLTNGATITSNRFGIVNHQGMGAVSSIVVTDNSVISAKYAGILVKERASSIEISDGAAIHVTDGPILQAVVNDDKMAGGGETGSEAISVAVRNTTLTGDLLQSLPGIPMSITLTDAVLTGAISTAVPTFRNGGNTGSGVEDRNIVGVIDRNSLEPVANTGLSLTLSGKTVWNVTETSYLTSLTVGEGAVLNGSVTVAGTETVPAAGTTYTGNIVVTPAGADPVSVVASRGEIASLLYSMEGAPAANGGQFSDVSADLAPAVAWASANGIMNGYGGGQFGPNDPLTREQMSAILYRYAVLRGEDVSARADLSGYTDAGDISGYAMETMQWSVASGLLKSVTDTMLAPRGTVSAAEAETMLTILNPPPAEENTGMPGMPGGPMPEGGPMGPMPEGGQTPSGGQDTELKLITRDYTPVKDLGMKLDGLYTGEDYGKSLGDKTVAAGQTWKVEDSCTVDHLEIEAGAKVEADFPVIVFFSESKTVQNGQVMGNVQFVSDYDEVVAVVHTNDTHGFLSSEPYVKGLRTQLEQSGRYSLVLTVSGGDLFAGGYAAAHVYEGEYIPYIMSDVYDYLTWGNNDGGITDKGIGTYFLSILGNASGVTALLANQNASETIDMEAYAAAYQPAVGAEEFVSLYSDVLSLNSDGSIDYSKLNLSDYFLNEGDNALDDGVIVTTKSGTRLGIFGESTQGGSITDAYFAGGQSTIEVAQKATDALRADGASAVIMLCHTGWMGADSTETSSNDTNTAQVALNTTGIDAIVDGHTHSVINEGEGWLFDASDSNTIVNQANCKGEAIGVMYLFLKDGKVVAKDCENIVDEDGVYPGITPDAEVQAMVDRCFDRLAADGYTTVYATSEHFLNGERISSGDVGGGVRANETNLGDLVADGILYTAQKRWEGKPISIALYPGFWVRASIPAGDITMIEALSVFANPLKIYYKEYTAEELVAEMNTSCAKLGQENNQMFQVAGLTCTYDPETFQVVSLKVGDELIYENGSYLVDASWTVGCAAEVGGGDMAIPEGTEIVGSNAEMARLWCEFLASGEYTIYPDVVNPNGRVIPAN